MRMFVECVIMGICLIALPVILIVEIMVSLAMRAVLLAEKTIRKMRKRKDEDKCGDQGIGSSERAAW